MSRPCSCKGYNENCDWCGGSGIIKEIKSLRLIPRKGKKKKKIQITDAQIKPKVISKDLIYCHYCQIWVDDLSKHNKLTHGKKRSKKSKRKERLKKRKVKAYTS